MHQRLWKNKLLIIALVISISCNAQFSFGIIAGYTNNHLNTDIANRVFTENRNGNGYDVGILGQYDWAKWLSLQVETGLIQKNYSFTRTGNYAGVFENFSNTYLQVGLTSNIKIFEVRKIKITAAIGAFTAYWILARVKGRVPNIFNGTDSINTTGQSNRHLTLDEYSEKYKFDIKKDARLELGWLSGINLYYEITPKAIIMLNCHYYQSLTGTNNDMVNVISKINQTTCVSIGYLRRLKAKK